jgi:hypothetical protein
MAGWLEVLGITISKPHVARVPEHQPHSSDHCMIGPCDVTASNFSTTYKHSPIIDIATSVAIPAFEVGVQRSGGPWDYDTACFGSLASAVHHKR